MAFAELNDKITPTVCPSKGPTSTLPHPHSVLEYTKSQLCLVIIYSSLFKQRANSVLRTPVAKYRLIADLPYINLPPSPNLASPCGNGNKNKTSIAMRRSSSPNWFICATSIQISMKSPGSYATLA
jgi:hypothetical protein